MAGHMERRVGEILADSRYPESGGEREARKNKIMIGGLCEEIHGKSGRWREEQEPNTEAIGDC